jgi:translation initiation factor 1 (eIF-1/SUI1)
LRCAGNGGLKNGDLVIQGSLEETDELVEMGDST